MFQKFQQVKAAEYDAHRRHWNTKNLKLLEYSKEYVWYLDVESIIPHNSLKQV